MLEAVSLYSGADTFRVSRKSTDPRIGSTSDFYSGTLTGNTLNLINTDEAVVFMPKRYPGSS
jgi:hypothetical protein